MFSQKKVIFTLNVDDYAKEITAITYPLIRYYADKIGADFHIINKRIYPDMPVTYEKLQIFDLGSRYDWIIYIDSDALVHPNSLDWTNYLPRDTVAHFNTDPANIRWRYNEYFLRDGRNIGSCNWFAIANKWCLDLWHPLDDPIWHLGNIFPTTIEANSGIGPEHLIDDYTLSLNIARYGLKCDTIKNIASRLGFIDHKGNLTVDFFYHIYTITEEEKIQRMNMMLQSWMLPDKIRHYGSHS